MRVDKICASNIDLLYPNDNEYVKSYMEIIIKALEEQYSGNIPDYLIISLDMMRDLWKIYMKANNQLATGDLFITSTDTNRTYMNPAVKLMNDTHAKIMQMCKELGITIFSKKKIKMIDKKIGGDDTESDEEFLERLTS